MPTKCPQCGEELLGAVNSCWRCGQPVPLPSSSEAAAGAADEVAEDQSGASSPLVESQQAESPAAASSPPRRPAAESSARAVSYPQNTSAIAGSVGAIVMGALGILGSFFTVWSLLVAFVGIAMGLWGLASKKRREAIFGLILCGIAVTICGVAGIDKFIDVYSEEEPLDERALPDAYEGELDT